MQQLYIHGGTPLKGTLQIPAAKNAVLPMMAAALLTEEPIAIHNVSPMSDIINMAECMRSVGVASKFCDRTILLSHNQNRCSPSVNACCKLRASFFMLGALVSVYGQAVLPLPGGCRIGARPVDIHLSALRQLGADISIEDDKVICRPSVLRAGEIHLSFASVGATENILMAAVLLDGITVLHNAAIEPEVTDLVGLLRAMGAVIDIQGNVITIQGVTSLHGADYTPIGDRIIAGTYLCAVACCGGDVSIQGVDPAHVSSLLDAMGGDLSIDRMEREIHIVSYGRPKLDFSVVTSPYPGFATDLQPILVAMASAARGKGSVCERLFENRFAYVDELVKMGADISVSQDTLKVRGKRLHGASISARDLRGGAALIVAALAAQGESIVKGIEFVDRGYYRIEHDLTSLGAKIYRKIF